MCKVCKDLQSIIHDELYQFDLTEDAEQIKEMAHLYFAERNFKKFQIEPNFEKSRGQFGMLMMLIGVKEMMEYHGIH